MTRHLTGLYDSRFDEREIKAKDIVWRELARHLQRYVDRSTPVLDIACDRGEFIRYIQASERWASDIRDVSALLPADVRFVQGSGLELERLAPQDYFGTVFISNYLEHLDDGEAVIDQLRVARSLVRPGGRIIVLQPNIRLVGLRYWDYIDHRVALTERSLVEATEMAGWRSVKVFDRFVPYTVKGRLPTNAFLVRAYLAFPPMWWLMGRQTLYVGERPLA